MEDLRNIINKIDIELIELLTKRMNISKEIAEYKIKNNIDIYDPIRENIILNKYKEELNNNKYSENIIEIMKKIIIESKRVQENEIRSIFSKFWCRN